MVPSIQKRRGTDSLLFLVNINKSVVGFLKGAYQIEIDEIFDDISLLTFYIPIDDPKSELILNDQEVVYKGERYLVSKIEEEMEENGARKKLVTCESSFVELTRIIENVVEISTSTPLDGLQKLLNRTKWTAGKVDRLDDYKHSMSEQKRSVLWLLRQWAKITGHEIHFDTHNRKINFVEKVGEDHGIAFKYKKNLKQIKRTMIAPEATILYPYGRGGMSIEEVNDGKSYIENFKWYEGRGIPLIEARNQYRKEYIWEDERFILPGALKRAAEEKLEMLSSPQISYEVKVADLSKIMDKNISIDTYKVGDFLSVDDHLLGSEIKVRVVKRKIYEDEPWKNEFEFNYLIPGLQELGEEPLTSSDLSVAQPSLLMVKGDVQKTVDQNPQNIASMAITAYAPTNAQMGFYVIGQASTDLTITIEFRMKGEKVGPKIVHSCRAGNNTIGIPFILQQIPQGSFFLEVFSNVDKGTFTILKEDYELYMYASNLLGGVTASLPRANIQEDVVFFEPFMQVVSNVAAMLDPMVKSEGVISDSVSFFEPDFETIQTISIEGTDEAVIIPESQKPRIAVLTHSITDSRGTETANFLKSINSSYAVDVLQIYSSFLDDLSKYQVFVVAQSGVETYRSRIAQALRSYNDNGSSVLFLNSPSRENSIQELFGLFSGLQEKEKIESNVFDNSTPITNGFEENQLIYISTEPVKQLHFNEHAGKPIMKTTYEIFESVITTDDFSTEERSFNFSNYGTHFTWDKNSERLKSINPGNNGTHYTEVSVNYQVDGELSFDWQVSSEGSYDLFRFYIDDVQKISQSGENSGTFTETLAAGDHILKFQYSKDGSGDRGSDCVWIDNLTTIRAIPTGEYETLNTALIVETGENDIKEEPAPFRARVASLGFIKDISKSSEAAKNILTRTIKWLFNEI